MPPIKLTLEKSHLRVENNDPVRTRYERSLLSYNIDPTQSYVSLRYEGSEFARLDTNTVDESDNPIGSLDDIIIYLSGVTDVVTIDGSVGTGGGSTGGGLTKAETQAAVKDGLDGSVDIDTLLTTTTAIKTEAEAIDDKLADIDADTDALKTAVGTIGDSEASNTLVGLLKAVKSSLSGNLEVTERIISDADDALFVVRTVFDESDASTTTTYYNLDGSSTTTTPKAPTKLAGADTSDQYDTESAFFVANTDGTGYSEGDVVERIRVYKNGSLDSTAWFNVTANATIAAAPTAGHLDLDAEVTPTSGITQAQVQAAIDASADVDAIVTDVAAIETLIGTTNTNLTTVNTSITTLDTAVDAIGVNVEDIETAVGVTNTNLTTINTTLTTLDTAVDGIGTDVGDIETAIGTTNTTLGTTNTNLTTINTTLTDLDTAVDSIGTDVGEIETAIGTTNTNLTTINTTLTELDAAVDGIATNVEDIETAIGTTNTNLATVNTNLTTIDTNLTTVNTNLTTIDGVLDSILEDTAIIGTTADTKDSTTVLGKLIAIEEALTAEEEASELNLNDATYAVTETAAEVQAANSDAAEITIQNTGTVPVRVRLKSNPTATEYFLMPVGSILVFSGLKAKQSINALVIGTTPGQLYVTTTDNKAPVTP